MLKRAKITATLLLTTIISAISAPIYAENLAVTPVAARITTQPSPLPKLGFDSQLISGYGEQVTYVERESKAFRLGLQQQDVILSVNDIRLTHRDAWPLAIASAIKEKEGTVSLKIRIGRTGTIVERQTNILQY